MNQLSRVEVKKRLSLSVLLKKQRDILDNFKLITSSGMGNSDKKSVDRLCAMFANDDSLLRPCQVVQSRFVLCHNRQAQ